MSATETKTELALIELPPAQELFHNGGIDAILENIETAARSYDLDVTTETGRKEIASVAYKIAKSKTAIDGAGKDLVAGIKAEAAKIDSERKKSRDFLDNLKAEIRKPLTEFEEAEKRRVATHETRLEAMKEAMAEIPEGITEIKALIERLEATDPDTFEEFAEKARATREIALQKLTAAREKAEKAEAERAELERLRAEKEERERKEREEKLKAEAAENARREAEEKAAREKKEAEEQAERERLETERKHREELERQKAEAEAKERQLREEQERKEAEARAKAEREAAEKKAAEEAEAKRIADEKHRGEIHADIISDLQKTGLDEKSARLVLDAIATNNIAHLQINY